MEKQQIMKKVNDSNKIILEKTFALSQAAKTIRFLEHNSSIAEENKEIIGKPEKNFKKDYKNYEIFSDYKLALYKTADQEI